MRAVIGPCAKKRVCGSLVLPDGSVFTAENLCRNPQPSCPRAPGEGYEKCRSVCHQIGHAEDQAIASALAAGKSVDGGVLYVTHSYACDRCQAVAASTGVTIICTES